MKDTKDSRQAVYEIGYLVVSSVPEEKVPAESDKIRDIIIKSGGSIIAEEIPRRQHLAYTMRRKTVSGSFDKFDEAYFGWIKFEISSDAVESVKKSAELVPAILRMLLITTVRENTYLGKRAAVTSSRSVFVPEDQGVSRQPSEGIATPAPVAPATIEEMDKSIDEMVKEA